MVTCSPAMRRKYWVTLVTRTIHTHQSRWISRWRVKLLWKWTVLLSLLSSGLPSLAKACTRLCAVSKKPCRHAIINACKTSDWDTVKLGYFKTIFVTTLHAGHNLCHQTLVEYNIITKYSWEKLVVGNFFLFRCMQLFRL